ncbi:MAG: nucleotide exchange factor GrpE [Candidatus Heimdallarchaeota archaeon]|nr:nucleotide exchange factor GrpE [Candidatus Heimdallarchaeota archaeon]
MKKENKNTNHKEIEEVEASLADEQTDDTKETTVGSENLLELLNELKQENTQINLDKIIQLSKSLINDLCQAEKERNEYLSILQRFKADFENYKKRAEKEADNNIRYSSERILSKIFEPIEDINRAINFAKENAQESIPFEGIEIIYNKLSRILEDEAVEIIAPKQGENFDPRFHEAVMVDESSKFDSDLVAQLFEQGYKIKGRVFRAAKVMVSSRTDEKQSVSENKNNGN